MDVELQKKVIIVSAPSGCGKSTIIHQLLDRHPDFSFSISSTTRKIRPNEKDGLDYYFLEEEDFIKRRDNSEFLEWANVHGNFYGTTKKEVKRIVKEGKYCILDIDVQGAIQVSSSFPHCKRIFILPPSIYELERRLKNRGDTPLEEIRLRMTNAKKELGYVEYYQYFVVNTVVEQAVNRIEEIILS